MNGSAMISGTFTNPSSPPDIGWKVTAVGDDNLDARPDIVWRHQGSGQIALWFMNDATLISGTLTNPSAVPDLDWKLVGPR